MRLVVGFAIVTRFGTVSSSQDGPFARTPPALRPAEGVAGARASFKSQTAASDLDAHQLSPHTPE